MKFFQNKTKDSKVNDTNFSYFMKKNFLIYLEGCNKNWNYSSTYAANLHDKYVKFYIIVTIVFFLLSLFKYIGLACVFIELVLNIQRVLHVNLSLSFTHVQNVKRIFIKNLQKYFYSISEQSNTNHAFDSQIENAKRFKKSKKTKNLSKLKFSEIKAIILFTIAILFQLLIFWTIFYNANIFSNIKLIISRVSDIYSNSTSLSSTFILFEDLIHSSNLNKTPLFGKEFSELNNSFNLVKNSELMTQSSTFFKESNLDAKLLLEKNLCKALLSNKFNLIIVNNLKNLCKNNSQHPIIHNGNTFFLFLN